MLPIILNIILFQIYLILFKSALSFLFENSKSSLLEKVAKQGNVAVSGVIRPFFAILENLFTTAFLILLILLVNLKLSLIVLLLIIIFYTLFIFTLSKK